MDALGPETPSAARGQTSSSVTDRRSTRTSSRHALPPSMLVATPALWGTSAKAVPVKRPPWSASTMPGSPWRAGASSRTATQKSAVIVIDGRSPRRGGRSRGPSIAPGLAWPRDRQLAQRAGAGLVPRGRAWSRSGADRAARSPSASSAAPSRDQAAHDPVGRGRCIARQRRNRERRGMAATDRMALAVRPALRHAAAYEGIAEMQLVDPPQ